MKYLDFDLAIEPSGDGYTARVFNSPGGQASADFSVPFSDLEIENFLLRVGRSRHTVRRIESPELTSAKIFGGRLFQSVFAGDVRGCLRSSLDEAQRQNAGLRVRLHLSKAAALADLPWEFLYNQGMNRFLGLSVETPLVRFLELPERIRAYAVQPPLRVLMMISSPSDYPQLDVSRESAKMADALAELQGRGLVAVDRQEVATLSELQKRLRQGQYHIFHFIGHGGFDEAEQDGVLVLQDAEGRGRRVSAQFLGTLLHDHRPLRLAVLNACEGARASRHDPFAGTAQTLVQQGIPAVIAMQFEVTDEAAICFTREFYSAIAIGYPVDAALAEARKAIFAEVSEIEWGTPVLYMRSPDGVIFEVEQVSDADRRQLQMSSLLAAARTAAASNDDATALARARELLAIDPGNADAPALLRELERQREVAQLYAAARTDFEAARHAEALEGLRRVAAMERGYRDVDALIGACERALAHASDADARRRRLDDLRRSGAFAMAQERWEEAIDCWQSLVGLMPDDQDGRAQLAEARKQQELARLYARGRSHYELQHWREALVEFHQLQRIASPYKDVARLVADIERELKAAGTQSGARSDAAPPVSPPQPGARIVPPGGVRPPGGASGAAPKPKGAQLFMMGGLLGAGVVVAAVLGVIVLIAIWQLDNPGGDTPEPDPEFVVGPGPEPPEPVDAGGRGQAAQPAPAPSDPNEMVAASSEQRAELELAARIASANEVQALMTMNPALLSETHTGQLYQEQVKSIADLRAGGATAAGVTVHGLQVNAVRTSRDAARAEVDLTLRYEVNMFSGGLCVGHIHDTTMPQTLYLQRVNGRWLATASRNHLPDPQGADCH